MWVPIEGTLLSEEQIRQRVSELAKDIDATYRDTDEVLLVGVLRGSFIFLADLARRLTVPNRIDFIALASYDGARSGAVRLLMDLRRDVGGQHVLVVEDIVDTGRTLDYLLRLLAARKPASLRCCSLLRKPSRLEVPATIDFLGFDIPDEWVVGYGLDYADQHRTLPYVGLVKPPARS